MIIEFTVKVATSFEGNWRLFWPIIATAVWLEVSLLLWNVILIIILIVVILIDKCLIVIIPLNLI